MDNYLSIYHPDIQAKYISEDYLGEHIIKTSRLIDPDIFEEEDVVRGAKGDMQFYISEVDLSNRSDENSSYSIFKGILFHTKFNTKKLFEGQIQSKRDLLQSMLGSLKKHPDYDFYYSANNEESFLNDLKPLFPFVNHLAGEQGDIRISVQRDGFTILLKSDMKFMDSPEMNLGKPFNDESYMSNMSRQLNTLFFILDSFTSEMDPIEIEEKLELRMLEYAKKQESVYSGDEKN